MRLPWLALLGAMGLAATSLAAAADSFTVGVLSCAAETDRDRRLECYDRAVAGYTAGLAGGKRDAVAGVTPSSVTSPAVGATGSMAVGGSAPAVGATGSRAVGGSAPAVTATGTTAVGGSAPAVAATGTTAVGGSAPAVAAIGTTAVGGSAPAVAAIGTTAVGGSASAVGSAPAVAGSAPAGRDSAVDSAGAGKSARADVPRHVAARIASVEHFPDYVVVHLDNQQTWKQVSDSPGSPTLRNGDPVTIDRQMGSYWLAGPKGEAVQVRLEAPKPQP